MPTQAHELLLATSFTPEWLRREVARTLGQMHRGRCVLRGRDVDVLYGAVHDLATRNPLSEALHRHLDARHALALRAAAAVKDEAALEAAWALALADDGAPAGVPAALWAVLTHARGEAVQSAVLYDARAWVFGHARRSVEQALTHKQIGALLREARQRADELQARLLIQQQQSAQALRLAQAEIARLHGELARRPNMGPIVATAFDAPVERCPEPPEEPAAGRASDPASGRSAAGASPPRPAAAPVASPPPPTLADSTVNVAGRRVLCVGGIRHAVVRYRGRIEKLGGRFEHHDGGIEDGMQALDARLGRADIVICQAACINHEAYHRVKRHCDRTGTPCVYLDRPSLSRLDRALAAGRTTRDATTRVAVGGKERCEKALAQLK